MWNWLKSVFAGLLQDEIKRLITLGLGTALAGQGAVLWAYGKAFFWDTHPLPGWVILSVVGVGILFVSSVALNIVQWQRTRRRNFAIVAEGHPMALHWSMGKNGERPVMQVSGDFSIANLSQHNLVIPRIELIVSYKVFGFIPRRRRVAGIVANNVIQARKQGRDRLIWMIDPPVLEQGQTMSARPVIVDSFDHTSKGKWREWPYVG